MICFCYSVSEQALVEAIRNGCRSLMDIRKETFASSGCAGCAEDVKKLLRKYAVEENEADTDVPKASNG
jgi:NAD(P)H-nitrite reductase large subunit